MNRRELIKGIGRALCAGAAVPFIPSLIGVGGMVPPGARMKPLMQPQETVISKHLVGIAMDCGNAGDIVPIMILPPQHFNCRTLLV